MPKKTRARTIWHSVAAFLIFFILSQLPFLFAMLDPHVIHTSVMDYFSQHREVIAEILPQYTQAELDEMRPSQVENIIRENYAELIPEFPADMSLFNLNPFSYLFFNLIICALYAFLWNREEERIHDLHRTRISGKVWLFICGAAAGLNLSLNALLDLMRSFGYQESREDLQFIANQGLWLLFVSVIFIAPFLEEFFFRGILFNRLRSVMTLRAALVVNGIAFALMHGLFTMNGVAAFLMALLTAALYLRTGSIKSSIVAHMGGNSLPMVLMAIVAVFMSFGGDHVHEDQSFSLTIFLLPALALTVFFLRQLHRLLPPLPDLKAVASPYTAPQPVEVLAELGKPEEDQRDINIHEGNEVK